MKLSQHLSPKPTKHDMALPGGTRLETALKTGCNWNDGTTKTEPSSGNGPTTRFNEEAIIVVTAEQAGEKTVKAMAILMEARIDYICASIKM